MRLVPETPPESSPRSSEELALDAQAGSSECFAELVRRHERALYAFLRVRTRSAEDAEDVAQEAFVLAWTKLATYRTEWRFATWLFTVARNAAASRARRSRAPARGEDELAEVAVEHDPAEGLVRREESSRVWQLAERVLGPDQRSALWLRYAEDLGIEEIAKVLGRRPVAVRVMLFRAREVLAQRLAWRPAEAAPGCAPRAEAGPSARRLPGGVRG